MKILAYIILSIIFILSGVFLMLVYLSNATIERNLLNANTLSGIAEVVSCKTIKGWAWDSSVPNAPVKIGIIIDSDIKNKKPDINLTADKLREDISSLATEDNGLHGFEINTPDNLKDNKIHEIYIYAISYYDSSIYTLLKNNPSTLQCKN